ncbi:hypothetical protein EDF68_10360 [Ochrobactrum sp. BH3]|nr:hypothetical protein EDF68_10360 [Ochrobactrum sp. BH3]
MSLVQLERHLKTAARLVVDYGTDAIPILERVEKEIEIAKSQNDAVSRAQAILRGAA